MPFTGLSNLLGKHVRKRGLNSQVQAAMILEFFKQVIDPLFDAKSRESIRPLYLKNGTLMVAVLSPALAQELKLHEPDILKQINKKVGFDTVKGLRFLA